MSDVYEGSAAARLQRLHAEVASPATLLPQAARGHGLAADPGPAGAADWLARLTSQALDAEALTLPTALDGALGAAFGLVRLQVAGSPGQAVEVTSRDGKPLDVDAASGAALPVDGRGACWLVKMGPEPCAIIHADGIGVQLRLEPASGLWLAPLRLRTPAIDLQHAAPASASLGGAYDDVCAEALALWPAGAAAHARWMDILRLIVGDRWSEPPAAAEMIAMLIAGIEPPATPVDRWLWALGGGGRAELRRGALQIAAGLADLPAAEPADRAALAPVRAALEALRVALARHDGLSALDLQLAALDRALLTRSPTPIRDARWLPLERGLAPTAWWVGAVR